MPTIQIEWKKYYPSKYQFKIYRLYWVPILISDAKISLKKVVA